MYRRYIRSASTTNEAAYLDVVVGSAETDVRVRCAERVIPGLRELCGWVKCELDFIEQCDGSPCWATRRPRVSSTVNLYVAPE